MKVIRNVEKILRFSEKFSYQNFDKSKIEIFRIYKKMKNK